MLKSSFLLSSLFAAGISTAYAQQLEFEGAEIGATTFALTDEDHLGYHQLYGSVEIGLTQRLSFQIDASVYDGYKFDENTENLMFHTVYDMSDYLTLGAFLGFDYGLGYDEDKVTIYGVEGTYDWGKIDTEMYYGRYHEDDDTAHLFGISGIYAFENGFSLTADYDRSFVDGIDIKGRRLSVGALYDFGNGPQIYAKVGKVILDFEDDDVKEPFIQLGAQFTFGPNHGTSFDRRSIFESLPNL